MFGIIARSRPASIAGLTIERRAHVETPYGRPSAPLIYGAIAGKSVVVLLRHGDDHEFPPHRVNYRANIQALYDAGVEGIVAIATVGGLRDHLGPGTLLIPDQVIDYTSDRAHTFYDADDASAHHVDFTWPFSENLRRRLLTSARNAGIRIEDGGCYGATNGPRLESAAEIRMMQRDGCDVVGMTGMPEIALARERGIPYGAINIVVNYAAGLGDSAQAVAHDQLLEYGRTAMITVARLLANFIENKDKA
ncbi:MAG: S-methyl-5'-thioinosine phosphorylase [Alphaproteobacteria bacterium]|nr:S-methyl-5'-thioinosine phosphorylase [Alphaproteobacteria bacterium]